MVRSDFKTIPSDSKFAEKNLFFFIFVMNDLMEGASWSFQLASRELPTEPVVSCLICNLSPLIFGIKGVLEFASCAASLPSIETVVSSAWELLRNGLEGDGQLLPVAARGLDAGHGRTHPEVSAHNRCEGPRLASRRQQAPSIGLFSPSGGPFFASWSGNLSFISTSMVKALRRKKGFVESA